MRKNDGILIPLEDLYGVPNRFVGGVSYGPGGGESPDHLERAYGVTVVLDHRDRPSVSQADAYKIRDARKAAAAEIHAAWLADMQHEEQVAAWQRAREDFWSRNYLPVGRAIGPGDRSKLEPARRTKLGELVLQAEAEAGIPPEIAKRLTWPPLTAWASTPGPGQPNDTTYHAPKD